MSDKIEAAKSSRSACRQCGEKIQKGTLRFGEEYESEYGLSFRWYHLPCAAEKLPALLKKTLEGFDGEVPERDAIEAILAGGGVTPKEIFPDYPDVSLAPTGRAACIQCGEKIEKGSTRISVEVDMEIRGRATRGAGYMHPACVGAWLGENDDVDGDEFNRIVTAKGGEAAKAKAPVKAALPEIAGQSEKALRALAKKLTKLRDKYRIGDALEDAVGWKERERVFFHLFEHDALDAGKNVYLAVYLDTCIAERSAGGADLPRQLAVVERVLAKLPSTVEYAESPMFPNLPGAVFQLATFLWKNAPEQARTLYPNAKANVQTALALAMALDEAELPDGAAEALTRALATHIGQHPDTVYGLWDERSIDIDALAAQLGTEAILKKAGLALLKKKDLDLQTLAGLGAAMRTAPPKGALEGLAGFLSGNGQPDAWGPARDVLADRPDVEALATTVAEQDEEWDARRLLLFGLLDTVSPALAATLSFDSLSSDSGAFVAAYEGILHALGETEALALGTQTLASDKRDSDKQWIPLLHRVFGEPAMPLLRRAVGEGLLRNVHLAPEASLVALAEADIEPDARTTAEVGIAVALAKTGQPVPETLDDAIAQRPRTLGTFATALPAERMNALIDASMEKNPPEALLEPLCKAPEPVRRHTLVRFVERRKKIKRTTDARRVLRYFEGAAEILAECLEGVDPDEKKFWGILEKAFSKDVYASLAEAAGRKVETAVEKFARLSRDDGGTTLFFPARGELEPLRAETLSYAGGPPPPGVTAPSGREEDKRHVLTLDLSPFPDLVSRFGAETMSLFVEAPNSGAFNDEAELVRSGKLDSVPEGGRALEVGAVKLPEALRQSGRTAEHRELRSLLYRQDGHAFGPAYWIQENLGDSVTLQLNDAYMNLGDAGSLYIGNFGTTWQCH
ncbi:MAG: hypothetical protein SangKO_041800 [Sandaracinaceae bacterium]